MLVLAERPGAAEPVELAPSPWVVAPAVDLLFVCGLAPWILAGLTWLIMGGPMSSLSHAGPAQQAFTMVYVACAFLIGEGHQFTSIMRFFFANRIWKIHWFEGLIMASFLIAVLVFVFAPDFAPTVPQPFSALGMILFPVVLMHHFCIQARTIMQMYCGKAGYKPGRDASGLMRISMWTLVLAGACSMAVPFAFTEITDVTDVLVQFVPVLRLSSVLCFALPLILRGVRKQEWMPLPAVLLWLNLSAYTMLPMEMITYVWLFVPIFFHASQHWAVAYAVRKREGAELGREPNSLYDFARLFLPVQAVSLVVLFLPLWLAFHGIVPTPVAIEPFAKRSLPPDITLPVAWSMVVFYLHYFTDRIVWRPR